jgi:hypothetical protein
VWVMHRNRYSINSRPFESMVVEFFNRAIKGHFFHRGRASKTRRIVIPVTARSFEKRSISTAGFSIRQRGFAMLKVVVLAMALAALIGAQVKLLPVQWTDACVNSDCIVGP